MLQLIVMYVYVCLIAKYPIASIFTNVQSISYSTTILALQH